MILTKLLAFALYSYCNQVDIKLQKIKSQIHEIKLVAFNSNDPEKKLDEIQQLLVNLTLQLEELDGE